MMRSMFSGVSGLRNHQIRMDVIGNNIANVNTIGYKKNRVTFQDMLSQTIRGAAAPQGGKGGINPQQVGLGMNVSSIDTIHTQGSSETTGKATDMMIDGDGFFIVADGTGRIQYFTRAGNFDFDSVGNLVNANGLFVQGWVADADGNINTNQIPGSIKIPQGQTIAPKATTSALLLGNLDAEAELFSANPNDQVITALTVYDSLGRSYTVNLSFQKTGDNTWNVVAPTGWNITTASTLTFDPATGKRTAFSPTQLTLTNTSVTPSISVTVNIENITQYAFQSGVQMNEQNGYAAGELTGYSVDNNGVIVGRFSNGLTKPLAQVAMANFNNPAGLMKAGENMYIVSSNSGEPVIGPAGAYGMGYIAPGKLEMSNVDLAQEFTDMIITQRGFQANSRIISVSDEMLQELVNLKR